MTSLAEPRPSQAAAHMGVGWQPCHHMYGVSGALSLGWQPWHQAASHIVFSSIVVVMQRRCLWCMGHAVRHVSATGVGSQDCNAVGSHQGPKTLVLTRPQHLLHWATPTT